MRILFSPVGTADPITQLGDGPMLHIVRHYQPDKVVIFLSPKMRGYEERDARYSDAIKRLCAAEGHGVPSIEFVESSYGKVYRFDHYIGEFEQILQGLCAETPDEAVLVNVSSGTPGMSQALVAIGSFARLQLKMLQVRSPKRDANGRNDREDPDKYDCDTMWEWNEELRKSDSSALESRITEVETPNFADRLLRENIISLLKAYDYEAALSLATQTHIREDVIRMIRAARDRLNLGGKEPAKVFHNTRLGYRDLLGEYLAVMEVRLEQGHWADFCRLMTPALTQVGKDTLRRNGLAEREYLRLRRGKTTSEVDWDAVRFNRRLSTALEGALLRPSRYIENWMLADMIDEYCVDSEIRRKFRELRNFEEKCRNMLAHEIVSSDKSLLERVGGMKLVTVRAYLFDLHAQACPHLYENMNNIIIDTMLDWS